MNRIIKRLAAYFDESNNKNNDINQNISDINYLDTMNAITNLELLYNTKFEFFEKPIYKYTDNIDDIDVGLCGNSFKNKNGDKIVIEFHVKKYLQN